MNSKTLKLLENVCRTCMNSDEEDGKGLWGKTHKTISIFNELEESMECKNITIMELLMLTTPQLKIESGDMLPKILCDSCLERLISAYKFQKMCITVDQKFRKMVKEEIPPQSKTKKDPLKDVSMDVSTENLSVSETLYDLSSILKIEMDEPLIDQNETIWNDINAGADSEDKFELDKNKCEDMTNSENSDVDSDKDSDWEIPLYYAKSKKCTKMVKKLKEEIHKTFENNDQRDEQTSEISESKKCPKITKDGENKKFVCDECGNRLSTRKSLKRHKRIHLRPAVVRQKKAIVKKIYECEFCKRVFQQSRYLKDHLRTHSGERPFLCSECGKSFTSSGCLNQHSFLHLNEKQFSCPDCPKSFLTRTGLVSHSDVHNAKPRTHVCDICGRGFSKPFQLKKHKMYHTNDRPFSCEYCGKRFLTNEKLQRHVRIHTGEKPYKCNYCEKAYCQSSELTKHLRIHLGNDVYQCELCPLRFPTVKLVREHFSTHKNDDAETKVRNLAELNALTLKGIFCR